MGSYADVLVAGASLGGVSAALAAARCGLKVILLSEHDWVGGQLTSQGVPPDEHGWIEEFGCTATYRDLRNRIREYYRAHYPLTAAARTAKHLNPGNGWVSPLCHEPIVSHRILQDLLASSGVEVWHYSNAIAADVDRDHVRALTVHREGQAATVEALFFLDATELGDILPLTGAEFETGSPGRPANSQAFSWCFAMEHYEGQDNRIPRPARYEYWRDFIPNLTPPWPGKLLSWVTPHPRTMQPQTYNFAPHRESPKAFSGLWSYRRLIEHSQFAPGRFKSDICLVNWPIIDYLDRDLNTASPNERALALEEAREMSLCAFYWMQTEGGFPGLKLAGDALGTADGFAKEPYIRESRRIKALTTIEQRHVQHPNFWQDSVGIGSYRIDLHPTVGGDNYVDVESLPFQIPLGALVPQRLRNFLPACKNIGTTHVTNGCYRLHPVEWNIGEAVGLLAAYCQRHGTQPQAVAVNHEPFQSLLRREGLELEWPANLALSEGDAHKHAH
jgi:hypothetical protein